VNTKHGSHKKKGALGPKARLLAVKSLQSGRLVGAVEKKRWPERAAIGEK